MRQLVNSEQRRFIPDQRALVYTFGSCFIGLCSCSTFKTVISHTWASISLHIHRQRIPDPNSFLTSFPSPNRNRDHLTGVIPHKLFPCTRIPAFMTIFFHPSRFLQLIPSVVGYTSTRSIRVHVLCVFDVFKSNRSIIFSYVSNVLDRTYRFPVRTINTCVDQCWVQINNFLSR